LSLFPIEFETACSLNFATIELLSLLDVPVRHNNLAPHTEKEEHSRNVSPANSELIDSVGGIHLLCQRRTMKMTVSKLQEIVSCQPIQYRLGCTQRFEKIAHWDITTIIDVELDLETQ
jgi:hypothetical protein